MKNFACLILIGLLVNMTMANLIENDAIDRFKRGSERITVNYESISATKKSFIEAQIKTLSNTLVDRSNNGKIAKRLSDGLQSKFGGRWMVLICELDEICSFAPGKVPLLEYYIVQYKDIQWAVYRV
jgi:hypothetical protein